MARKIREKRNPHGKLTKSVRKALVDRDKIPAWAFLDSKNKRYLVYDPDEAVKGRRVLREDLVLASMRRARLNKDIAILRKAQRLWQEIQRIKQKKQKAKQRKK